MRRYLCSLPLLVVCACASSDLGREDPGGDEGETGEAEGDDGEDGDGDGDGDGEDGDGDGDDGDDEDGDEGDGGEDDDGASNDGGCDEKVWWFDADGDGFGDFEGLPEPSCKPLEGYVENNNDCNDEDSAINPEALEACDEIDNDCDGNIDEYSTENPVCGDCTNEAWGEHAYAFCEADILTWHDAQQRCEDLGGELLIIDDEQENDYIMSHQPHVGGEFQNLFWIGLSDEESEGDFVWVDGTDVEWTNWSPGQPDNANDAEHCVHMWTGFLDADQPGTWNDERCDKPNVDAWVCELVPQGT